MPVPMFWNYKPILLVQLGPRHEDESRAQLSNIRTARMKRQICYTYSISLSGHITDMQLLIVLLAMAYSAL